MSTTFRCPNKNSTSVVHSNRIACIMDFINVKGKMLKGAINDLLTPIQDIPIEIYNRSFGKDCNRSECFVMKYLLKLLRAIDRDIRIEISKDVGILKIEEVNQNKRELMLKRIRALINIGIIYDRANYYSMYDQKNDILVRNRFDLFIALTKNPDAVKAILYKETAETARLLLQYSPFLSKLYLNLLAHDPNCVDILTKLKAGPRDFESQKKDLEDFVLAARIMVTSSKKYRKWADGENQAKRNIEHEAEEILITQLQVIKDYLKLHFIRLGALYIDQIRNNSEPKIDELRTGKRNSIIYDMLFIFKEMSNFSNAILSIVTTIVSEYFSLIYGQPNCAFTIMLGGANARMEFPSFDYDALAIYEKEGKTRNSGIRASITHREFFNLVFQRIINEINNIGFHLKPNFQEFIVWYDFQTKKFEHDLVPKLTTFKIQLLRKHGKMLYAALSNLIIGAGDISLGNKVNEIIAKHIKEGSGLEYSIAMPLAGRAWRDKESKENPELLNIKRSPGGLRDINEVNWVNGLCSGKDYSKVLRGLLRLPLSKYKRKELIDSYIYLINLRIRLDLYFGRNEKDLPIGHALDRFASALGYNDKSAGKCLMDVTKKHMNKVRELTDESIIHCLKRFPKIEEKIKEIVRLQNDSELFWIRKKEEAARKRVEKVNKKTREIVKRLRETGRNDYFGELWAHKYISEIGEETE